MYRPNPKLIKAPTDYERELLGELFKLKDEYCAAYSYPHPLFISLDFCPKCAMIIRVDHYNYMIHLFNCVKARRRYRI